MKAGIIIAVLCGLAGAAEAEVVEALTGGFEVRHVIEINAPAEAVYAALLQPSKWWNPEHSWSGDAANLTLEPRAGGCYCEALPKGGMIEHMRVVALQPNEGLRLFGGLGPLQFTGASGFWNLTLKATDSGTTLTATYDVGGYAKGGLDKWAAPVDGVLAEQYGRLKAHVEAGK
ncbi:SRPBCC family protein [Asticcacaulis machinosus]|uniref:SRPBCC family protein n=1 Tax=Asticcacaulis machinosus TaxID=2984211 RepID=A0ABT5HEX7_9CAUL|nr:SRPBCC family protein [Asticcacaulis machinosus]MDC7674543.1 SRPBCC family protein [Asticcacaulis machinosus]